MAEAFNLPVVSHVMPEMHCAPGRRVPERADGGIHAVDAEAVPGNAGDRERQLVLPTKPGLGLKFDEKAVAAYRVG